MKELLIIKDFSVFYDSLIIDNISLTLCEDELVGLIGHNGCGKSTMLKGIMGSLKHSGIVRVKDHDFMTMKIKQRAQNIAMLTQRIEIVEGISAGELIGLGSYPYLQLNQNINIKKVKHLAEILQIESLLNKDYSILSEGQKQLVQIARIIMQDTPVLLLDEPDSALDFNNRYMIFEILQQLIKSKHKTALIVLHNPLYALMYCDRVLLMDDGKIISEIKPQQENCEEITKKIQLIYSNIIIKKDDEYQQYYYLTR